MQKAEPMGALLQHSSSPLAEHNNSAVRGAVRKIFQPGNPTFDTWLYVWAVRNTRSVLEPVHDLTRLALCASPAMDSIATRPVPQSTRSNMQITRLVVLSALATALVAAVLGCGGKTNVLNPAFQPQVNNATDNFQFQATNVQGVTQTLGYTWQNTGIAATVNQATTVTAGQAVVTIKDANGTQVYMGDLVNNGTFTTATGITGNWTITLTLTNYSGTLNFRVQKKP